MSEWRPIKSYDRADRERVDVWLSIHGSPSSAGWSDAFRVTDAHGNEQTTGEDDER